MTLEWVATAYGGTVPTGTADGDIMIAVNGSGAGSSPSAPAGWTLIYSDPGLFTQGQMNTYYRIASSEPASYTFGGQQTIIVSFRSGSSGFTVYPSGSATPAFTWEHVAAFDGVHGAGTIAITASAVVGNANGSYGDAAANIDSPSVTPSADATLVFVMGASNSDAGEPGTPPSGGPFVNLGQVGSPFGGGNIQLQVCTHGTVTPPSAFWSVGPIRVI